MSSLSERRKISLRKTINLAAFLANNSGLSARTVCEVFGISRSELIDHLNEMLLCGVPPYGPCDYMSAWIEGDRVRVSNADWLHRPLDLCANEALSLKLMLRSVAGDSGEEAGDAAGSLEAKIAAFGYRVPEPADESLGSPRKAGIIRRAIRERRVLRIVYFSRIVGLVTERMIEPFEYVDVGGIWCLAAYCRYSNKETLFAIARIRDIELGDEVFGMRAPRDKRPRMYLHRWCDEMVASEIRARFDRAHASWAREEFAGALFEDFGDGGVECIFRIDDPYWVTDVIANFDGEVEVGGLPEFRKIFDDNLKAVESLYRSRSRDEPQ